MKASVIIGCLLSLSSYCMEQKLSCCRRRLNNFAQIVALLDASKITFVQPKPEPKKTALNKILRAKL